ncbi:MAG: IPT/TIG domain-containing protein [Bryobacteraceae bacterium]
MIRLGLLSGVFAALAAHAQLIPAGSPVPQTTLPPVVFINGYQFEGCPSTFAGTFGIADQVLQANGEVSLFFSTCSLPSSATIEDLATSFGTFLAGLKYTDGSPVETVDVVAHSMGGLVLRSYLSGKQDTAGVFQPPAATHVRKAILLATPNFGTPIASLVPLIAVQVEEMASGSAFVFDLDTWNDATDDLRGVDAIAAVGNAGTGLLTGTAGFDDGVVPLTSGSLRFYGPGRTRVVPYCHIDGGGIITLFNLCPGDAKGIADIDSATHDSAQMIVSFLNGTNAWQSVGTAAESDPFLSVDGGLIVAAHAADDTNLIIDSATATQTKLGTSSNGLAFSDLVPAGSIMLLVNAGSADYGNTLTLPAGGTEPYLVKPGPLIARVFPAAAANFPLELAPRMLIAIYGSNLASGTVSIGGSPLTLDYVSATQINAVLPDTASGLTALTVQNSSGQNSVNVYVGTAAPSIFTQDSSGTGPASALKATDQSLVTASNPLHAGDSVELYATGLGLTSSTNGFDVAVQQPTVTVGGVACPVTFAGAAPNYVGLDQINCTIPAGLASSATVSVVVTSGDRTSNTATVAIQ